MQSNKAFGTRKLLKIAIVASLVGAAWLPAAFAAPAADEVVDQAKAQAMESWRSDMARVETPTEGCFQASFPSVLWKQVNCTVVQPRVHPLPRRVNKTAGASQTTGNGDDYAIKVSGLISSTVGTFPSVTGVTSEKSVGVAAFGGGGILGPNEYTLQANSNYTGTTAACKNHSGCTIWQQFIYSPDYQTQGQAAVFIQYWLLGYGSGSCPSGFGSDGAGDCYKNSSAVTAPDVPITQLANLKLSGSAASGGNDKVVFTNGSTAYTISAKDSVLDLASVWNETEFNIVGNAGGSEAVFNSGSTIKVNVAVSDGSTTKPTCAANSGSTGETNNLNLGSCTASSGTSPSIQFTESN
jgi:hypothetical protein